MHERGKSSKHKLCIKLDGGMPQTKTKTTAVWGTPILFKIKLRAFYRVSEVSRKNKKGGVIVPDDNIT
jgi:hypothetical protein